MYSLDLAYAWQRNIIRALRRADEMAVAITYFPASKSQYRQRQRRLYRSASRALVALANVRESKKKPLRFVERALVDALYARVLMLQAKEKNNE